MTTTTNKPSQQVEWVPIVFIFAACYLVTLLFIFKNVGDVAIQGAIGIATTFAGAAAGAYGQKVLQHLANRTGGDDSPAPQPSPLDQGGK